MKTNNFRLVKILGSLIMCMIIGVSMMVSTTNQAEAAKVKAVKAVQIAKKIAKNNKNGYSQASRTRKNKLGGHEYDCSSFVYTVYKKAGVGVGMGCSSTIKRDFKKKGFKYISRSKAKLSSTKKLQTGDVLVASGHVEIYAGSGKLVGAHRNYDGKPGDSTGKEISVTKYYSSGWYGILRYTRGSSKTTTTAKTTTTKTKTTTEDVKIAIDGNNKEDNNSAEKTDNSTATDSKAEADTTTEETKEQETDTPAVGEDQTDSEPAAEVVTEDTTEVKEEQTEVKKETTEVKKETTEVKKTTTEVKEKNTSKKKTSSKYSKGKWKANLQMNVRRGPGLKYKSIGVINKGTTFKVTKVSGRFGKIKYKGKTAWVSLKYSTKVK